MLNPTEVVAGIQILALKCDRGGIEWRTGYDPPWRVMANGRVCGGRTLAEALEKMLARGQDEPEAKPKVIQAKVAGALLSRMMNDLPEGSTVSVERETVEVPPKNGWRRYRRGNKLLIEIHPPPTGGS